MKRFKDVFAGLPWGTGRHGTHERLSGSVYKKGELIGQRYEVYDVLGIGGFGVVYLVYLHDTKSAYALKTLRDEYLKDPETRERFRKEAGVWVDLQRHPYIVRAYFVDEIDGRLYVAMEYVAPNEQGLNSLAHYLGRQPPNFVQSLRWAIQACYGMEYAYSRGIRCHRDIKPENILIGHGGVVKISDFGLAAVVGSSQITSGVKLDVLEDKIGFSVQTTAGRGFGTPTHMAPEQFMDASACDERSDIYSFGVVLYQMRTAGQPPFLAPLPRDSSEGEQVRFWQDMYMLHRQSPVPELRSRLFPVIQRCLSKVPNERYQSFRELRGDLQDHLWVEAGQVIGPPKLEELENCEWVGKGASLVALGHLDEAMRCFDRVLEVNSQDAIAWNDKGYAQHKMGRYEEALACFEKALEFAPEEADFWVNKGNTLY